MTKAPSIKEALEETLREWDKYDPYVSREGIVRKANAMAEAIRATLSPPAGELGKPKKAFAETFSAETVIKEAFFPNASDCEKQGKKP